MSRKLLIACTTLVLVAALGYVFTRNGTHNMTTTEAPGNVRVPETSPRELKALMDQGAEFVLLDVRRPDENEFCALPKSLLIPITELEARVSELDTADRIVVYCRTGVRSFHATAYLQGMGFAHVSNLTGGIHAWSDDIDPSMPKY